MNPFSRKKTKDANGFGQASEETSRPSLSSFGGKSFKRTKKNKKLPKPELDIANALPATDDLRTSLLMPNLSARFSMLREQNDPNTKIGKASDDSVLYPRRTSRLNVLSDIAEVGSIKSSVRPPFAYGGTDSYASGDDYGTDDEANNASMLARSRPGEGNNLFGGRQKIYKIPTGGSTSVKDLSSTGAKFIYENDVSLSAFQKLREKERERERALDWERDEQEEQDRPHTLRARVPSPTLSGYNRNRETSSSTNSGPSFGRVSTAATSIASQGGMSIYGGATPALPNNLPSANGLDRSTTKSRRLYEHGLDQHLHEQQSSAMTRLDAIARQRNNGAGTPPPGYHGGLSQATSLSNLNERYDRSAVSRSPSIRMRAASPQRGVISPNFSSFQFGLGDTKSPENPIPSFYQSPPLSPPHSEGEDSQILPNAIRPSDRGKATALGTFNKPVGTYDEHQYSQRQLQMQQGRESPSPHRPLPHRQEPSPPIDSVNPLGITTTVDRSGSESSSNGRGFQIKTAASRIQDSFRTAFAGPTPSKSEGAEPGTFLAPPSGSDISSVDDSETEGERLISSAMDRRSNKEARDTQGTLTYSPPAQEHVEHRLSEPEWMHRDLTQKALAGADGIKSTPVEIKRSNIAALSPLLSPDAHSSAATSGAGLSGLVKQHLRNDSGASSVYGQPSPIQSRFMVEEMRRGAQRSSKMTNRSAYSHESPWDGEEWDGGYLGETDSAKPSSSHRSQGSENRSLSMHSRRHPSQDKIPGGEEIGSGSSSARTTRIAHSRGPSTETQKERAEFANELAERRKKVQDNLKGQHTEPSGAQSKESPAKPAGTLGILKNKTSQSSVPSGQDSSSKAMRMLGINGNDVKSEQSERRAEQDKMKEEEERMLRSIARGAKSPQAIRSLQQGPAGGHVGQHHQQQRPSSPHVSPPSSGGSDGSGSRPRHRNGRTPQTSQYSVNDPLPPPPQHPIPAIPTKASKAPSAERMMPEPQRTSPTRRPSPPHDADNRHMHPLQTSALSPVTANSPRPSPMTPFSANSTPSLVADSPGNTSSALTSPVSATSRAGVQTFSRAPTHHKRWVNKADISEPTFVSCTSSITTVNLPPGASLSNGVPEAAPPVPPINPLRRRLPTTQAMLTAFGRTPKTGQPAATAATGGEFSRFSDHEREERSLWQRHKPRRSSDGWDPRATTTNNKPPMMQTSPPRGALKSPSPPHGGKVSPPIEPAVDGSMF